MEAGFPSSKDLTEYLIKEAGSPHCDILSGQRLDSVAQYLYHQEGYGKSWVRRQVIDLFEEKHSNLKDPPSQAHKFITTVQWRTIFTTNYDRVVEYSYYNNSDCSQRLLPVYKPDPQIRRHEPNKVHLIKLNGSVDEADRNSDHELVLTFNEQRDARSRNADFYDLLRAEAVNGPIIFIGFRFSHPGTNTVGTSPEFEELKELLREMGSAGRTHYCISPFDSDSNEAATAVSVLKGNHVTPINAKFGEFCAELKDRLAERPGSLREREAVIVPISSASLEIDPDDYDKDKRHFEIIGDHLRSQSPPSLMQSLNGEATWDSFIKEGHFIERLCRGALLDEIDEAISEAPEIVFFEAPAGWGKTFLLRSVAVEYFWRRRPVFWLNPYGSIEVDVTNGKRVQLGTWDANRIERLLNKIASVAETNGIPQKQITPLIIADDCVERAPEILSLFRSLSRKQHSFVLLFSSRDVNTDGLFERYPTLRKARTFSPDVKNQSPREVQALIDFCADNDVATFSSSSHRKEVKRRIVAEGAHEALLLALYVIFDREHRPFSEIVEEMWTELGTDQRKKLVLRVAAMHRFGATLVPRLFSLTETFPGHEMSDMLDMYSDCRDMGVLIERLEEGEPCVGTIHPLIADYIASDINDSEKSDQALIGLVSCMSRHPLDLEVMRKIAKRVNDYQIHLTSEEQTEQFFESVAESSNGDWVICHQYANYLRSRRDYEGAVLWIGRALEKNPNHSTLQHTKGTILQEWAIKLYDHGETLAADRKIEEARECFSYSRVEGDSEYGYVTHLDMLLELIRREGDTHKKTNLRAEGASLYRRGLNRIEKDRYNVLLADRFQAGFGFTGDEKEKLLEDIGKAVEEGAASSHAAIYLVDMLREHGKYEDAISVIHRQRGASDDDLLTWVKEAEIHARFGYFHEAAKTIDSAKRREGKTESKELYWKLAFWELLIFVALNDYSKARQAVRRIREVGVRRRSVPQGYFWKESARDMNPHERTLSEHAKVMEGQVKEVKPGGNYGQVAMRDPTGEGFYLPFNPKYFSRGDFRRGDHIKFAITILPTGLRADDLDNDPFVETSCDLFLP